MKEDLNTFIDTEFDMAKAYREFKEQINSKQHFSNADSIRSTEDNMQLAVRIWNMKKFNSVEELYEWLCRENKR